jgi:hypothetical protein
LQRPAARSAGDSASDILLSALLVLSDAGSATPGGMAAVMICDLQTPG